MKINIRKKIILLTTILLISILTCLITAVIFGRSLSESRKELNIAEDLRDNINVLMYKFEKTMMAPHDYIIHQGNIREIDLFKSDYEDLQTRLYEIKSNIVRQELRYSVKFSAARSGHRRQNKSNPAQQA